LRGGPSRASSALVATRNGPGGAKGPLIHRAASKIATGQNPADNFGRRDNTLWAIDLAAGQITRVVPGTGIEMVIDGVHPDTGRPISSMATPGWEAPTPLGTKAAGLLAGTRTQSWDTALTDLRRMSLEMNFDLNHPRVASGAGVLDAAYREQLRCCGYRL